MDKIELCVFSVSKKFLFLLVVHHYLSLYIILPIYHAQVPVH